MDTDTDIRLTRYMNIGCTHTYVHTYNTIIIDPFLANDYG